MYNYLRYNLFWRIIEMFEKDKNYHPIFHITYKPYITDCEPYEPKIEGTLTQLSKEGFDKRVIEFVLSYFENKGWRITHYHELSCKDKKFLSAKTIGTFITEEDIFNGS